ncbi:MAG: DsrE family protein [Rhodospirillales bacterium]|nr:DsrE family protein [Rhodospirillales bacterium]
MPPAERSLICILHSGDYERVRFTLAAAAAAAAADRDVTLFFTMDACVALQRDSGWHDLQSAGGSALDADTALRERGVAGFEELLGACRELGVRLIVCEMGLHARGLSPEQLVSRSGIEVGGLFSLLSGDGAGAQLMFA